MKGTTSSLDRSVTIRLQNVGIVTEAKVALSGITVIAGPNKSGKSTIGRALMAYGTLLRRMDELVRNRRLSLLAGQLGTQIGLSDYNKYRFQQALVGDEQADDFFSLEFWKDKDKVTTLASQIFRTIQQSRAKELIENFSNIDLSHMSQILDDVMGQDENAIIHDIMDMCFRDAFVGQINSLYSPEKEAIIELFEKDAEMSDLSVGFKSNHLLRSENKLAFQFSKILYLEPLHLLDFASGKYYANNRWTEMIGDDDCSWDRIMKSSFGPREDISPKDKQDIEKLIAEIKSILGGELDVKDGRLQFKETSLSAQGQGVELENLASGMKSMTAILKALDSCILRRGRILVIDEPESNLHPEWQVKFAFVLVHLWIMLGVRVVVATHSPYFLKALETCAAQLNCLDNMSCYFMQPESAGKGMVAKDVTNRLNEVYKSFFDPLNNLMAGNGRES